LKLLTNHCEGGLVKRFSVLRRNAPILNALQRIFAPQPSLFFFERMKAGDTEPKVNCVELTEID